MLGNVRKFLNIEIKSILELNGVTSTHTLEEDILLQVRQCCLGTSYQ